MTLKCEITADATDKANFRDGFHPVYNTRCIAL